MIMQKSRRTLHDKEKAVCIKIIFSSRFLHAGFYSIVLGSTVTLDGLLGKAYRNFKITILGQKATRCHALCICVTNQQ